MADGEPAVLRRESDGTMAVVLAGRWRIGELLPPVAEVERAVTEDPPARISFDSHDLEAWDSRLVSFVARVLDVGSARHIPVDPEGLPEGVRRLLALASAAPRRPQPTEPEPGFFERVGRAAVARGRREIDVVAFVGETATAVARLLGGRASFRVRDLFLHVEGSGARAVFIVGLVSFLVGLILAFIGSIQLRPYGAMLYVADLVAVAMVREMSAIMAAIVLAGRTGAAFAAELGTMRVTQEIDALDTIGIPKVELLVLPRLLALTLMLPFLCVFADFAGVLGGAVIGTAVLGFSPSLYLEETYRAVTAVDFFGGLFKAGVYGALVAGAGCFEGLRSGRSAAAVGQAATAAVVDGIVLVIAAAGVFSVVFYLLEI